MSTRLLAVLAALMLTLAGAACAEDDDDDGVGGTDSDAAAAMTVDLAAFDFRFDTQTIPVELGAVVEVNFTNNGAVAHSFTVPDLDVELELEAADSGSVTFAVPESPGAYEFFCKFHPDDMTGSVTVGGEGVPQDGEDDPNDVNDPDDVEDDDDEDAEVDVEVEST